MALRVSLVFLDHANHLELLPRTILEANFEDGLQNHTDSSYDRMAQADGIGFFGWLSTMEWLVCLCLHQSDLA